MSSAFYGQFGEDRVLARIFADKTHGVCVEVGANDGVHGSASLYFEQHGWRCVLIEPNPDLCAQMRASRSSALVIQCAASNRDGSTLLHVVEGPWNSNAMSTVSEHAVVHERIRNLGFRTHTISVPTARLDDILANAGVVAPIDFVTIDVEGHEPEVLAGFSILRWRPAIVIVEDNTAGASDEIESWMGRFEYVRFRRTGVNDWYAHRSNRRLVNLSSRARVAISLGALRTRSRLRRVPWLVHMVRALRRLSPSARH